MSGLLRWLTDRLSRALPADERSAVLGDLMECGDSTLSSCASVLGLVARRQSAAWRTVGPWCGLLFLARPVGCLLCSAAFLVGSGSDLYLWILRNRRDLDPSNLLSAEISLRREAIQLVAGSALLVAWSWSCGFVLRTLSRSLTWLNMSAFCLVVISSAYLRLTSQRGPYLYSVAGWPLPLGFYTTALPLLIPALFVVAPAFRGVADSHRRIRPQFAASILIAALVLGAELISVNWRISWQSSLLLAGLWPAGYLILISISKQEVANGKNLS